MTQLKARPTTYKGIQMRSRLEAGFAQWLDRWNTPWVYEPKCFGDEHGQYLPDFLLPDMGHLGRSRRANYYVEIKPRRWQTLEDFEELAGRMHTIWSSEPDASLLIATPGQELNGLLAVTGVLGFPDNRDAHFAAAMFWSTEGPNGPLRLTSLPLSVERGPWYGEWWKG